jgi:hypothetical protein
MKILTQLSVLALALMLLMLPLTPSMSAWSVARKPF